MRHFLLVPMLIGFLLSGGEIGATSDGARLTERWRATLRTIDQQLQAGQYREAKQATLKLQKQMLDRIGVGRPSAYTLAVTCAFRAFAEVALGESDEALWSWRTAMSLFPEIEKTKVEPYGSGAAHLKSTRFRERYAYALEQRLQSGQKPVPPQVVKSPYPKFPEGMRRMGIENQYAVQVIIDVDGIPKEPLLLKPPQEPALAMVIFDAVRQWRFKPVMLENRPVPAVYTLTVNFEIR